jgi:hypothetical protein
MVPVALALGSGRPAADPLAAASRGAVADASDLPASAEPASFATAVPGAAADPAVGWSARSPLALGPGATPLDGSPLALRWFGRGKPKPTAPAEPRASEPAGLGAERARTLLRSIVFPGWGQAALGHRTSGTLFALAETGVWASFAAFRIQEQMRRQTYERTALLYAGIDLDGRSEEYRRLVGAFESSEDYNRLVVYRDAANLYYDDPERYRAYIATHELKGADAWDWSTEGAFRDYRGQRKDAQRAALRANAALAMAVVNRLASTLHAARLRSHAPGSDRSWRLELGPVPGGDATAFRCAVGKRF